MATLTVTHTEDLTLNGYQQGSSNSFTIASITDIYKRVVTCPADAVSTIARFNSAVTTNDAAIDVEDAKYIRLTNMDSSNSVYLYIHIDTGEDDSGADSICAILLSAGESFIMGTPSDGVGVNTNTTAITNLNNIESIVINPSSNEVIIEILVACI